MLIPNLLSFLSDYACIWYWPFMPNICASTTAHSVPTFCPFCLTMRVLSLSQIKWTSGVQIFSQFNRSHRSPVLTWRTELQYLFMATSFFSSIIPGHKLTLQMHWTPDECLTIGCMKCHHHTLPHKEDKRASDGMHAMKCHHRTSASFVLCCYCITYSMGH